MKFLGKVNPKGSVSDCKNSKSFLKRPPFAVCAVVLFLVFFHPSIHNTIYARTEISRGAYVASGIGDARILIPFLADDSSSGSICELVYNGLTKTDKDLKITGDLAESWEVLEGGLKIVFHLRKDAKWHDGTSLTASDVEFTYRTILDPETGCPYISSYRDIEKITVIDPYTIRFDYSRPYAPALLKFGMGIIPEHLYSGFDDLRKSPYARAPVGTGPYKFVKWQSGQFIILKANPDYYEHRPHIKRYVYRIIPDQAVQFLELVAGGIDSMNLNPYQFHYRSETRQFRERINKYSYLAHSYTYIGYNLEDPLFSDRKVRKALSYAINKKEIIEAVLLGLGEPCTGPFLKNTPYYAQDAASYDYDPGKARHLLKEAGWEDNDKDGVLEKDGRRFSFILATNQGNQVREDIATIVQRQWSSIGVRAEIQVVAWSAFIDQFVNKKNFQATILGWTLPIDPDLYAVWHSDSAEPGGLNFISYSDKSVDRLIEEGRRQFDKQERARIYRKIHRMIAEDAPYTFLYFPHATPAVNKRFKGIIPAPAGIGYNFIDWYVPEDEVKYDF
ncbi:MAG: peptide-binding protein [Candidatus Omnitrophica bacterium]|nr:peptide-binding protein [Candidatus Omnitrophota bacterium]